MKSLVSAVFFASLAPVAAQAQTVFVNQGSDWSPSLRQQFYTQDQGSRIIPATWMRALKLPDGQSFLFDALARCAHVKTVLTEEEEEEKKERVELVDAVEELFDTLFTRLAAL